MMRALSFAIVLAAATPASADILFGVFAEGHVGGESGKATGGDQVVKDSAFFAKAPGFLYGFQVGANLLFINAWIQHDQFTDGDRIATWTQFGTGVRQQVGFAGLFAEFGAGAWYGFGTGQQVTGPYDGGQVTDKAILLEGRVGAGKHINRFLDIGLAVPVSWGYFFKSGNGASVTDLSTHYQSVQSELLLFVRGHVGL
jgi:hypothetical protein